MRIVYLLTLSLISNYCFGQNIGIFSLNPTKAKLEVLGVAGGGATSAVFGGDVAGVSFQTNWPTIGFNQYRDDVTPGSQGKYLANGFAAIQYFDPTSGNMVFDMFASGTARAYTPAANGTFIIKANGNVGIRNTNPGATLSVGRGTGEWGTATFRGIDIQSHFNFSISENTYIRGGTAASGVFINKIPTGDVSIGGGSGRVAINDLGTIPGATVQLIQPYRRNALSFTESFGYSWHQQVRRRDFDPYSDLYWLYGNTTRGFFAYFDGKYYSVSDKSLKTNVEPIGALLDKINLLKPVSYEMQKDNPDHKNSIGFIAQEVKELFPLLVRQINSNDRSGEPIKDLHTMNYSGFAVLAIKALQEQHSEIQQLQGELDALLVELNKLYN